MFYQVTSCTSNCSGSRCSLSTRTTQPATCSRKGLQTTPTDRSLLWHNCELYHAVLRFNLLHVTLGRTDQDTPTGFSRLCDMGRGGGSIGVPSIARFTQTRYLNTARCSSKLHIRFCGVFWSLRMSFQRISEGDPELCHHEFLVSR